MNDKKDFEAALKGKKVPLLVLDQKWHRLFAIHGKTDEISATEKDLDELLKLQGKYNNELKNLKKLKSKIMSNIVANMGDDGLLKSFLILCIKDFLEDILEGVVIFL
jgi:hypothetical protein